MRTYIWQKKQTRRAQPKKPKAVTITKLKAQLWKECRRIIIARYGTTCYTCSAPHLSGSNLHIGHFIPSSVCSTEMRYDLGNLRPQCYRCNIHLSGNWPSYERNLIAYGIDVQAMKQHNENTKGLLYGRHWIENKITEYQNLL